MDNVHTRIKADVQQAKNEAKKYIQLPVSELDYLLRLFEEVHESKFNILAARDNERNLKEQARKEREQLLESVSAKKTQIVEADKCIQRLKHELDICKSSFEHWNKESHRLFSENIKLRKVLEFYADWDSNYDPEILDRLGYIPIDQDGGNRARAALKGEDIL